MNPIKLFKTGKKYSSICPKDKMLISSFPEIKIIIYIKLSTQYIPPLIVFLCVWNYYFNNSVILTLIAIAFIISLPTQGFLWLGKRANSALPLNLVTWYNQARKKLIEHQFIPAKSNHTAPLNFMDFMQIIHLTKFHFGHYLEYDDDHSSSESLL